MTPDEIQKIKELCDQASDIPYVPSNSLSRDDISVLVIFAREAREAVPKMIEELKRVKGEVIKFDEEARRYMELRLGCAEQLAEAVEALKRMRIEAHKLACVPEYYGDEYNHARMVVNETNALLKKWSVK